MKVIQIASDSYDERERMVHITRQALKRNLLENTVLVAISADNPYVIYLMLDSTVSVAQETVVRAIQKNVKKFMDRQDAKAPAKKRNPLTLPDKKVVYASRFGTAWGNYR